MGVCVKRQKSLSISNPTDFFCELSIFSCFCPIPCRSWRNDYNVHVQDLGGTVGINVGGGVVLLTKIKMKSIDNTLISI